MDLSNHVARFLTPKNVDEYVHRKKISSKGPIVPHKINCITQSKLSIERRQSPEKYRFIQKVKRL